MAIPVFITERNMKIFTPLILVKYLVLYSFLMFTNLLDIKCYWIFVSILFFLITSEVEHFFIYFLGIWIFCDYAT